MEVNTRRLDEMEPAVAIKVRNVISQITQDLHEDIAAVIREKDLIDTGALLNSLQSFTTLDGLTGEVWVGVHYGIYLEFGTIYMAARPFVGPAFEAITPEFFRALRAAVREGVGEA
jgi:HK97 gp10 family phage protein